MADYGYSGFVRECLLSGMSESDTRKALEERTGLPPDTCRMLIRQAKADYPELAARVQEVRRQNRRYERATSPTTVLLGIGLFIAGAMVTVWSYSAAGPGGTYLIASGLMLVGLVMVLKGIWHLIRWW